MRLWRTYKEFEEKVEVVKGLKTEQIKFFVNKRFKFFTVSEIKDERFGMSKGMSRNALG